MKAKLWSLAPILATCFTALSHSPNFEVLDQCLDTLEAHHRT